MSVFSKKQPEHPVIDPRLGAQGIDKGTGDRVIIDTIRKHKNSPEELGIVDGHGVTRDVESRRVKILK